MKQEILLIVSIALLGAVEAFIQLVFGASTKVITVFSPTTISLFGAKVTEQQLFLSITAVILSIILTIWLYLTRNGLAFRAMQENQTTASSIALSTTTAKNIAALIVVFTACVAGIFIASERGLNPHIGTGMVITAFVLATLGGKNARTWLLVSILFSAFEILISWYLGGTLANVFLYTLVFLYLLRERFTVSQWINRLRNTYA